MARKIDKFIEWFYDKRAEHATYSMENRWGNSSYDCSSSVYYALIFAGVLPEGSYIGNTDTLLNMGANGKIMYEIPHNQVQYGDIFVRGKRGSSGGAYGHTGAFVDHNTVIHMNYSANGISIDNKWKVLWLDGNHHEHFYRVRAFESGQKSPTVNNKNIYKIKNENWSATAKYELNIRTSPEITNNIATTCDKGYKFNYDQVWHGDGYWWLSYIGKNSGNRVYIAYRTDDKSQYFCDID